MSTPPSLPKRKNIGVNVNKHKTYRLEDFVGKSDDFIKSSIAGTILVSYDVVVSNLDLLRKIISTLSISQINCLDYESAVFLEDNLEKTIDLALVDDYQNKDRSYIDTTRFYRHNFYIPLSYFMWGVRFNNSCNVRCLRYKEYDTMTSLNGDNLLYRDTLQKLKEIIKSVDLEGLSDLDKCLLVSNYLQSKVQYVEDGLKSHADRVYVIEADEDEVTNQKVSSIQSVVNENFGKCMAIANTTTLLLNNPIMNVNVRSIYGNSHVWNIVTISGKQYYMDNTWAITRNKNRVDGALKASDFSDEYLLFGMTTSDNIGHHNSLCYYVGSIEQEDYSRDDIREHVRVLSKKNSFTNYSKDLRFKSRIEK